MQEPIAETRETYDVIAAEFASRNAAIDAGLTADIDTMTAGLAAGGVIVDVGCGPGRDLALLRQQGFRAVGIDLSIGQLRTGSVPCAVQADMRWLPLRAGSADAIWCRAALLHIPRRAVPVVLAEFARVMRPGGELYLSVAEGDGEGFEAAAHYGSDRRRWFTYQREPALTALLAGAGFAVHQVRRHRAHRDWLSVFALRAERLAGMSQGAGVDSQRGRTGKSQRWPGCCRS